MPARCMVSGCRVQVSHPQKTKRFRFPRDKGLRNRWLRLCGISKYKEEGRICELHFSKEQLCKPEDVPLNKTRILKLGAVPDTNLPVVPRADLPVISHHEPAVKPKDPTPPPERPKTKIKIKMSPSLKNCVPLSVKLKILDDQERGFGPKRIMKKYKVKKSTYYRIMSEKEMIRDYVDRGGSLNYNSSVKKEDEQEGDAVENSDPKDKENSDGDGDSNYSTSSGNKGTGIRILRIQDQITAFQRLQAGEKAGQIAIDMGVSRQTIQRIKKKFKDTLLSPTTDERYHISVKSTKNKSKGNEAVMKNLNTERDKESVFAAIERRKQLKLSNKVLAKKDQGLTYHEKIEAVAQCKAGVSLKQIAHDFGVSTSTIQRVKRKFSESHQLHFKNYLRLEQKVRILERLDEGETIMEIAEDLGVHDTTIRGVKKSRLKIMSLYRAGRKFGSSSSNPKPASSSSNLKPASSSSTPPVKAPKANKYENMEKKLLEWINNLKHWNIPLSTSMIQKKALMIQMHLGQDEASSTSPSFLPTKEWLAGFKRRNNIQKLSPEDSDSASDLDELRFSSKAAPKSKKKYFAAKRKGGAPLPGPPAQASAPEDLPLPPAITEIDMSLSKFAEGLREMYLSRSLPHNPYRCNAFTPRVLLASSEPRFVASDIVKTELLSDEETWLTGHTNAGSDSDWTEHNWDANSLTELSSGSRETQRTKRKSSNNEFDRKRRRMNGTEGDEAVNYNRNNYMDIPIKQEPQSSVDSISPNVPMAVLPAGSTYVPPMPMFQMPGTGLTVFMPESQQMMMQPPVSYPHSNTGELFMNQQSLRGRANDISGSGQFDNMHGEVNAEPSMRQDGQNMIVMPFGRDIQEAEKSKQLPSSEPDSVSDALAEKARKERAAAIAENIGMNAECSSNKKLRDLTFKLLELNGKNLICDDRIDKAKEEYEKTVAQIESEKRINDMEIDKVLSAIQEWKEARSNNTAAV